MRAPGPHLFSGAVRECRLGLHLRNVPSRQILVAVCAGSSRFQELLDRVPPDAIQVSLQMQVGITSHQSKPGKPGTWARTQEPARAGRISPTLVAGSPLSLDRQFPCAGIPGLRPDRTHSRWACKCRLGLHRQNRGNPAPGSKPGARASGFDLARSCCTLTAVWLSLRKCSSGLHLTREVAGSSPVRSESMDQ